MERPEALAEEVADCASFLAFARALLADLEQTLAREKAAPSRRYDGAANDWENFKLEHFLESAIAWAEDGRLCDDGEHNPWRAFARFLIAGKHYE